MIVAKQPRVYIAASEKTDTSVLRKLLEAERAIPDDAFSISAGEDVVSAALTRIREADLVIAIVTEDGWSSYEVGVADALRKPVLLIAQSDQLVPSKLARRQVLRGALADSEMLRLTLRKLLADVRRNPRRLISARREKPRGRSVGADLAALVARIRDVRSHAAPSAVEELAQGVLRAASAAVAAQPPSSRDKGVDFAVIDDDLSASVGGSLLVEVKAGTISMERLKSAEAHLLRALTDAGAGLGLLLYLDVADRRFPQLTWEVPPVLRFDLEDFAVSLLDRPLASIIVEQRNRLAHGTR